MTTFFADLLQKGSARFPKQTFGSYYRFSEGAADALGAILAGTDDFDEIDDYAGYDLHLLTLFTTAGLFQVGQHPRGNKPCPVCQYSDDAWDVAIHLNDAHHWGREAIAQWLDALLDQDGEEDDDSYDEYDETREG